MSQIIEEQEQEVIESGLITKTFRSEELVGPGKSGEDAGNSKAGTVKKRMSATQSEQLPVHRSEHLEHPSHRNGQDANVVASE